MNGSIQNVYEVQVLYTDEYTENTETGSNYVNITFITKSTQFNV